MSAQPEKTAFRARALGMWLRWAALALVLTLLGRTLAKADLPHAFALIAQAGPGVALILLPFLVAIALDTLAFRAIFRVLGRRLTYGPLLMVRTTAEAVTLSLPAGAVFAETLSPMLLLRRFGVPVADSVVAGSAKRWLMVRAQAGYIALSALLGYAMLSRASVPLLGVRGLPWLVLASAAGPLVVSSVVASSLVGGTWVERMWQALRKLPVPALRAWLDRRRAGFAATDAGFGRLGDARRFTLAVPTLLIFGAWLLESLETLLILRVLGAPVDYADVIGFEAGLALVRHLTFFAPAGIGVQDLGYIAVFHALGLPDASALGAAFVVLKRAKEIVWIIAGYVLLFVARRSPPTAVASSLSLEALP